MTVAAGLVNSERPAPAPSPADADQPVGVPRLADGVELLGEYQGSGYSQPPSLVRRADGQVIQMSPLLYQVACRIDGSRGPAAIAELVSGDLGRSLTADQVRYLITAKLLPLGIVAARAPRPPRRRPARCSRSGRGARCCPSGPRTPPERCCGRCSGGPSWRPWPPASRRWTTGCSPSTGWAEVCSRSYAIRWTCSSCSACP